MKKNWKILSIFLLMLNCTLSMGANHQSVWTKTLENLPILKAETRPFSISPKIYIFSGEHAQAYEPYLLRDPIYVQNNRALVSLEDLENIIQKKKIFFNEDSNTILIQQMKRIYMAIDKSAYLEQDQLKPLSVAPTMKNGKVYIPLRFVLEELGYCVNFNQAENHILLAPTDKIRREIVAKEKIDIKKIDSQGVEIEEVNPLVYDGRSFLGIGSEAGKDELRLVRVDQGAKLRSSEGRIVGPKFRVFKGKGQAYYGQNEQNLYSLDLSRGLFTEYKIPKMLEETVFFGMDQSSFYSYDGEYIYSYETGSKIVNKVLHIGAVEDLFTENGKLYFNNNGNLQSYSLNNGILKVFESLSSAKALKILEVDSPYIYFFDFDQSVFVVYNEQKEENILTIPFPEGEIPNISVTGNQYIAVGKNQYLDLYELGVESHRSFDLANLKEELNRGLVDWYWNGIWVQGYWKYGVNIEQKVHDQIIRIQP